MKFVASSGQHLHGRDAENITDELVVVNTKTLAHGYTIWSNRKPTVNEVPFVFPLPEPMAPITIAGKTDEPVESRSFEAAFSDGDKTILSFGSSSLGGKRGVDELIHAVKVQAAVSDTHIYPEVKLTSTSYENVHRGSLTYNPSFEVVRWLDENGEPENAVQQVELFEQTAEAAPTRRSKREV
jgi:hypothetical protein